MNAVQWTRRVDERVAYLANFEPGGQQLPSGGTRLRIGYFSGSGFHNSTTTARSMRSQYAMHNRMYVEVYCYAGQPDDGSEVACTSPFSPLRRDFLWALEPTHMYTHVYTHPNLHTHTPVSGHKPVCLLTVMTLTPHISLNLSLVFGEPPCQKHHPQPSANKETHSTTHGGCAGTRRNQARLRQVCRHAWDELPGDGRADQARPDQCVDRFDRIYHEHADGGHGHRALAGTG